MCFLVIFSFVCFSILILLAKRHLSAEDLGIVFMSVLSQINYSFCYCNHT